MWAFTRRLIGIPFMNRPNLEARGTELAKSPGRTSSVGKYSVGAEIRCQEEEAFEAGL